MKKNLLLIIIISVIFCLSSCNTLEYAALTKIKCGNYENPYIEYEEKSSFRFTLFNETIIKDAKISLFEISKEEYNSANGINAFQESLCANNTKTGRYIGIDLRFYVDEIIGYEKVELHNLEYNVNDFIKCYSGNIIYHENGELVERIVYIRCQSEEIDNKQLISITIEPIGERNYSDLSFSYKCHSIHFYEEQLIESKSFDIQIGGVSSHILVVNEISFDEYNALGGVNSFKQISCGEYENINKYFSIKIKNNSRTPYKYEITNIQVINKAGNVYKGDLKVMLNDKIINFDVIIDLYIYLPSGFYGIDVYDNCVSINDLHNYFF